MVDRRAREARFLQLSDVAEELSVTVSQVYHMVRSGELPAIKVGGRGQWRVERDRLEALYRVALALGLRLGEALGLSWEDVDFATGTLRVKRSLQRVDGKLMLKEPKTEKSRRALTMPQTLAVALRQHHSACRSQHLRSGALAREHGDSGVAELRSALDAVTGRDLVDRRP